MNLVKSWIAVAAIGAAVNLQVVADDDLIEICDALNRDMSKHAAIRDDGKEAFAFAMNWLKINKSFSKTKRNRIAKAWEKVYAGEKCLKSGWDHLVDLSICKGVSRLKVLSEPMKAFAKNCLTTKSVSEKIKSAAKSKVHFLDSEFIKKYHEANPYDIPLHVNFIDSPSEHYFLEFCCRAMKSAGALNDAIQRDLKKKKKNDQKRNFSLEPTAVSKYLKETLFEPCQQLKLSFKPVAQEFGAVSKYYEGGLEALIAPLDQETKNILFQYKYCDTLGNVEEQMFVSQAQKIVQWKSESS